MMSRLLEPQVRDAVGHSLLGKRRARTGQPRDLTPAQWQLMEQLAPFLSKFAKVTDRLGGQTYLTLSVTHKYINSLQVHCDRTIADKTSTKALVEAARRCKDVMLEKFEDTSNAGVLAMALDPRFKNLDHLAQPSRQAVWVSLIQAAAAVEVKQEQGDAVEQPAAKRVKMEDPDAALLRELDDLPPPVEEAKAVPGSDDEFEAYLNDKQLDGKAGSADVLAWWAKHKTDYPRLYLVARRVLAIPASSCPAERLFSAAGNVVTAKRTCLSDDKVDALTMLHGNSTRTLGASFPVAAEKQAAKPKAESEEKKADGQAKPKGKGA